VSFDHAPPTHPPGPHRLRIDWLPSRFPCVGSAIDGPPFLHSAIRRKGGRVLSGDSTLRCITGTEERPPCVELARATRLTQVLSVLLISAHVSPLIACQLLNAQLLWPSRAAEALEQTTPISISSKGTACRQIK